MILLDPLLFRLISNLDSHKDADVRVAPERSPHSPNQCESRSSALFTSTSRLGKARLKAETATGELVAEVIERLAERGPPFRERREAQLAERGDTGLREAPDQQSDRQPRDEDQSEPEQSPDR